MENERLNRIFREVFDDETLVVTDSLSDQTLSAWDSFYQVKLVIAVQEEFGISLSTEEAVALTGVAALKRFLEKRGITEY